ncbi:MAG: SDR family NAD(P)-dependent oxidoreductase, partial [Candidatus Velamenicoccus archaeovorus]
MELRGATCLVTGASGGIGESLARRLAPLASGLVLVGRDERRLGAVAERTRGVSLPADLGAPGEPERVAAQAEAALGRLDVLVHAAGIGLAGPFDEAGADDLEAVLAVDLLAPIRLTRLLLPGMLARRRGAIVFVASIAGHVGVPGEAV